MFCVICKDDNPESGFSDEHIVPEFLGGCLVIKDVCGSCNSRMGGDFEGRLSNTFLFKAPRFLNGISGKSGNAPYPFEGIHEMEGGRKVRVESDERLYLHPSAIDMTSSEDRFNFSISLDAGDKDKLPGILKKKIVRYLKSSGHPVDEKIIDKNISEAIETNTFQESVVENPVISVKASFDINDLKLLMIKIAYETACHEFGGSYLGDSGAELLRLSLFNLQPDSDLGNIWPVSEDEFFSKMLAGDFHWVLLVGSVCYIRLYDHWVGVLQYASQIDKFRDVFVAYRHCYKTQTVQKMGSRDLVLSLQTR